MKPLKLSGEEKLKIKQERREKRKTRWDRATKILGAIAAVIGTLAGILITAWVSCGLRKTLYPTAEDILNSVKTVELIEPKEPTQEEKSILSKIRTFIEDDIPTEIRISQTSDTVSTKGDSLAIELHYLRKEKLEGTKRFAKRLLEPLDRIIEAESLGFHVPIRIIESPKPLYEPELTAINYLGIKLIRDPADTITEPILPDTGKYKDTLKVAFTLRTLDLLVKPGDNEAWDFAIKMKSHFDTVPRIIRNATRIRIREIEPRFFWNLDGTEVTEIAVNYYKHDEDERKVAEELLYSLREWAKKESDPDVTKRLETARLRRVFTHYTGYISILIP